MTIEKYALPLPESMRNAEADERSVELGRVWWHQGEPHAIVRPALTDPAIMGEVLAEMSWHFADAYAAQHGLSQVEALAAMRRGWLTAHERGDALAAKGAN